MYTYYDYQLLGDNQALLEIQCCLILPKSEQINGLYMSECILYL